MGENEGTRDADQAPRHGDGRPVTERSTPAGMLAEFENPADLVRAAEQVRKAGYRRWDAHTPFPIHGLDRAMGIRDTALGWIVLGGGIFGCLLGVLMQWWMNAVDYPYIISGKPIFSLPANIPVIFELTILFSAAGAFLGMIAFNGLPRYHHPVFYSSRFARATSDRFYISIEAGDPKFDAPETKEFLKSLGGSAFEELEA
ncbi:DUF3341 domain-containing protein [bacterium]|nr:DUF3341 domain-containing protein [bacterium]